MSDESLFALGQIRRQREIPMDVEAALTHTAPQALLRDLHRPVSSFEVAPYEFEQRELLHLDAGVAATAEVRATALASYRVPICDLLQTSTTMLAEGRAVRMLLRQPWADAPKLGSRRADAVALSYFNKAR